MPPLPRVVMRSACFHVVLELGIASELAFSSIQYFSVNNVMRAFENFPMLSGTSCVDVVLRITVVALCFVGVIETPTFSVLWAVPE